MYRAAERVDCVALRKLSKPTCIVFTPKTDRLWLDQPKLPDRPGLFCFGRYVPYTSRGLPIWGGPNKPLTSRGWVGDGH